MADPHGVLDEIVARKRRDVAARLGQQTMADLLSRAPPTMRSLAAVIGKPGARFIMEVKRASPSGGAIRPNIDVSAVARGYQGVADAVSVLVDEPYFGGSYEDLRAVRAVFDGPILAKDFVVDPRQVAEARRHGADAVLVMLSVLDDEDAREVLRVAEALGMGALVEVHDEAEAKRAIDLGARIIGINNRDLRTLKVDLAVTERLAPLIPSDRLVVAESGIGSRADVERLAPHADAFLIGTTLMKAARPDLAAREIAFGRVKVCGLTSAEDAATAYASGASYAGMIFVPGTPRAVTLEGGRAIVRASGALRVGVFRDAAVADVDEAARELDLDAVQLHGREDSAYFGALRTKLRPEVEIWAASGVGGKIDDRGGADRLLFDTVVDGRSGGTGRAFDWGRIAKHPALGRSILAGGLQPDNARAAAAIGAHAIDVSSGVEGSPGRKDKDRLRAFFDALRPTARGDKACA